MYNCLSCGACCCHKEDTKWIEVSDNDSLNISQHLLQDGDIAKYAMRMRDNKCCCLYGILGKAVACVIYENRPAICHHITPGDEVCLRAREMYSEYLRKESEKFKM